MTRKSIVQPTCDQFIELMPDAFMIIDPDYRIVAANQKYCEHYGVSRDQVIGRRCHEVSHHSMVPCHQNGEHCPLLEVFNKRQAVNVVHVHYDKTGDEERVQLNALPLFDNEGEVAFMGEAVVPLQLDADDNKQSLMVGRTRPMLHLISLLQRVAPSTTTVLLQGESGVGKECAAQYIHHYSNCHQGPYIVVDCGTLGEALIERELFGHERGAFTGAVSRKPGLFEVAHGGTLVIDEISELPMMLQTKLLRVLETGSFRRIGGTEYIQVDVRIIAATNSSLHALVEQGGFRRDLYYRLSAFPVTIPPLRDRNDDVPALAEAFLMRIDGGARHLPLSTEVLEQLLNYDYPGNIRELRNVLERANILAAGDVIKPDQIVFEPIRPELPGREHVAGRMTGPISDDQVLHALHDSDGNRARAARQLGVSERTIYRHVRRLRQVRGV